MTFDVREMERKSSPENVARTLGFAGLLQLAHEFIKADVLHRPKQFYGYVEWDGGSAWSSDDDGADYYQHVLALDRSSRFNASLLWLQEMDALTAEDAERLARIKHHRDELTHNLAQYLLFPGSDTDRSVLTEAIDVFWKLDRFWLEIEIGIGTFADHPDATPEDVLTGPALILTMAVNAFDAVHRPVENDSGQ